MVTYCCEVPKTFAATGNLAIARTNHTATLLNDGTVLVIGGGTQTAPTYLTGTAELFAPTTQTFTGDGSLATPRTQHTATLLNDGTVLVVGGGNSVSLASAELYAPPLPVPASVTITPALTSMVVGQTQQFKALDQSGTQRFDVTWSVNNPSLASFASGSPMILTATGEGVVTLTATVEGVAAQLQITISPSWLQVTPTTVNMWVTGAQQFTAVDNSGHAANNVTWTVSNPSLATITAANPTVLSATEAGTVTLTATVGSVSAQAQITISPANTVLPAGSVLWSVPPAPGFTAMQIAQAVPTAGGPDLYSVQLSSDGTQSVVQALQADGEQMWQAQMPAAVGNSVPDGSGGLIVTSCPSGNPMTVSDFGPTGQLLWQEFAAGVNTGNGTITYLCNAPQIAVRGDGAVIVTEATNAGFPSVSMSGQMYPIPPSTVTNAFGTTIDVLCCVGPPMVNTDGTAYLEYEVRNVVGEVVTADALYLMQINPDNSSSSTVLSSTTQNETQYPGNIIPDGQGGVLATWSVSPLKGAVLQYPYQAVDVVAGVVGTLYNLPFSPQAVDITKQPDLVLGENGVAFVKGQTTATVNGVPTTVDKIISFNLGYVPPNLGPGVPPTPDWTYQAPAGDTLSIIEASDDGGVTINDSNNGVIQLNSVSSVTSSLPSGAVPFDYGTWVAPENGGVSSLWSPDGTNGIPTLLAQSVYPQHHGNPQGQSQPPFCRRNNCVLAPVSDTVQVWGPALQRVIEYEVFSLKNGTLSPMGGSSQIQQTKITLVESKSTNPSATICNWTSDPITRCESPSTDPPNSPGYLTDHLSAGSGSSYSVEQIFAADRGQVPVYWPWTQTTWYGAWNQTANDTSSGSTIVQGALVSHTSAYCPGGCSLKHADGTQ